MAINRNVKEEIKTLGRNELRKEGIRVLASTRPTKVKERGDDLIIVANEGDRLDNLAAKFYGSPRLWYVIASVNNLNNGSMHITPGTEVRIPVKSRVI
jgi:nucleoid-associated protein YgaU